MDELNLYQVDCNNIESIIDKVNKRSAKLGDKEVSVNNDGKYRSLRTIIMKQRKEIEELKSQNKILEELVSKN
tara:strand:- start:1166 stop:1384 length:219 start_codon:yes stop_codon:yes gene_type:complete